MRIKLLFLSFLMIFGLFMVQAQAQYYSYGYSLMEIDQPNPSAGLEVYAETGTVLTYNDWYWYDPGIQGFMYEDAGLVDSTERLMNYDGPDIYLWIELDANYGRSYKIHGDHYLRAFHYYATQSGPVFIDYWGFNYFQGNFPSPYNFGQGPTGYYYYDTYRAASTEVTLSAGRPLHLNSIDAAGGVPGNSFTTTLRGTGLFGPGHGGGGQTVQVSGGGVTATVQPTQPNTIEVVDVQISIASNAQPGDRSLTLTVNGQTSNSLNFRIGDHSPVISNISPDDGSAGDQVPVTITGSNFGFNPDVEIQGLGVLRSITSWTPTEIQAVFSIDQAADPGTRGVNVRSHGVTGTGFQSVPGNNSETSNSYPFEVAAANPKVVIGDIGSIEKGTVRQVAIRTENAPSTLMTKLTFKNEPGTARDSNNRLITGEARFVDASGADVTHIEYSGDQQQQIQIRGWERSTSKDNIELEARFDSDPNVKKDKSFTVSSVEFLEEDECTGYDDLDYQKEGWYSSRYLYVPKTGNNKLKAKIIPSGASGTFTLTPTEAGITVSPATITSTSSTVVTVSADATATNNPGIHVKSNTASTTRDAEYLGVEVLAKKEKKVVMYAVTEDNDDVREIPPGQGTPNSVAYVFETGANNFIDTVAQGDDWLGSVPIGQRPPGYSSRSRRVFTGENGILETMPQGDDAMYSSKNFALRQQYAPISELTNGLAGAVCIRSGANLFLDTLIDPTRTEDVEETDPNNPALKIVTTGPNGRCDTSPNNSDIGPGSPPNAGDLQNYLNNTTWSRQSNVHFTVTLGAPFAINFDLNKDKKLEKRVVSNSATHAESDAIKDGQNPPADTYNLYYVKTELTDPLVLAFAINIVGQHAYMGPESTSGDRKYQVPAHEIGHLIGSIHTAMPTTPGFAWYQPDLMYANHIDMFTQCRVRKPQWDKARLLP